MRDAMVERIVAATVGSGPTGRPRAAGRARGLARSRSLSRSRALALALALALAGGCSREPEPSAPAAAAHAPLVASIDAALRRGGYFLAAHQRADGSIPSRAYSALRDGWSLTPLAALALRMVSPGGAPAEASVEDPLAAAYRRAVDYLAQLAPGGVARTSPEVSYPLYAYAIGALVLGAPDNRRHAAAHAGLLRALRTLQLSPATGWRASDVSFGGWGYAWELPVRPAELGPDAPTANLSATLLAIGALVLGGTPPTDPALVDARGFLERCQNLDSDGGFFFSPALADANKAGPADTDLATKAGPAAAGRFRSYGSMTADGLRALLRLGAPLSDPRVAAAVAYLTRHFDATRNPGDFPPVAEVRRDSSYYYWAWSAGHALRHLSDRAWATALATELLRRQSATGAWRNPASEMREDDPLIATSFALAALALSRAVLSAEPRSHAY